MEKRKLARKRAGEGSLPDLLDRLELALKWMPDCAPVCKALSDLNRRLGAVSEISIAPTRRRRQSGMESLPLLS